MRDKADWYKWWQSDGYTRRVRELELEGMTTSDAQAVADVEFDKASASDGREV